MGDYYRDKLAADRLQRCYEVAPPAILAYLRAEVDHVRGRLPLHGRVLELGCGYGRILPDLADAHRTVIGIDNAVDSLRMGIGFLAADPRCWLAAMDAVRLGFSDNLFDGVICIQNGISAFKRDPAALVREALRVARPNGCVLFSSYAASFWKERLTWFRIQASHGLLGEIDEEATGDGVIVCRDGFRATTFGEREFRRLADEVGVAVRVEEVGGSSLFAEFVKAAG